MERDARKRKEMAIDENCALKTGEGRGRKSGRKASYEDCRAESATRKLLAQGGFFNCRARISWREIPG